MVLKKHRSVKRERQSKKKSADKKEDSKQNDTKTDERHLKSTRKSERKHGRFNRVHYLYESDILLSGTYFSTLFILAASIVIQRRVSIAKKDEWKENFEKSEISVIHTFQMAVIAVVAVLQGLNSTRSNRPPQRNFGIIKRFGDKWRDKYKGILKKKRKRDLKYVAVSDVANEKRET